MNILHVYKNYFPVLGGIEGHVRLLAEEQARRGHEVTVLVAGASRRTSRESLAGVRLIRAGSWGTVARAPVSVDLFLEIARQRPDITHLHFPYPIGELANLVAGKGRKTVITYHSDIVRQRWLLRLYEPFLRLTLRRADRIIATSPQYLRSSPFLRREADKCVVVPLGIDGERLRTASSQDAERIREEIGGPVVLFVGLLRYYKGLEYLIEAMADVAATLVIVGTGPMEGELRARAESSVPQGRVRFAGAVGDEELVSYYHACDVFVLPASHRSEAFGLAQVEAMFCEKPVVCTEVGTGTSYVNQDGVTGLVTPPRDAAALAAVLNKLLRDDELRLRLGRAAGERARKEFSKEVMFERIEKVYRGLAGFEV